MISNPIAFSLVDRDVDSWKKEVLYETAGGNET